MKILLLTVRADYGGGPQHIDLLINNLSDGFDIFIACPNDEPYYYAWQNNKKVKGIHELIHRKFSLKKLFSLNSFIKKNQITILHSHGKGAGIYSRLLKIINPKLKIIHSLHGFNVQQYGKVKKKIYITIEKFLSLFTYQFINVSFGEQNLCLNNKIFKPNKSKVIHNGIHKLIRLKDAKQKLNLQDKIVISTISRFDLPKNMFMAYTIAKMFKDYNNIIFLWIGDGPDKELLERKAKEEKLNIYFTGFTKDIPFYLSATDIYLSTSLWEGLPIALIEAQSLGIPIVATDVVGNNEVTINNLTGFLFKDENEAFRQILKLINDNELYNQFSSNSIKYFEENFEIIKMVQKIEEIYKMLWNKTNEKSANSRLV